MKSRLGRRTEESGKGGCRCGINAGGSNKSASKCREDVCGSSRCAGESSQGVCFWGRYSRLGKAVESMVGAVEGLVVVVYLQGNSLNNLIL